MPKKPPFAKGRRFCIFCNGTPVSGEHIWPDWADPFLPGSTSNERRVFTQKFGEKPREVERDSRQGAVKKRKVKAVCRQCNSEWMGKIETAAKDHLIPLFINRPTQLGPDQQKFIREWITLKLMVIEHSKPNDAVFTMEQRKEFYSNRTMPDLLYLYIFDCTDGPSLEGYRAQSFTFFNAGENIDDFPSRNTKLVTLVFGYLLILAVYSTEIDLELDLSPPFQAIRLWPISRDSITWPPLAAVTQEGAKYLYGLVNRMTSQPNITVIDPPS